MSQSAPGTIDPATTSGTDLATAINAWQDALHSGHSGAARPAYIDAGGRWVKEVSASEHLLMWFDGDADIAIARIDPTSDSVTPLIDDPAAWRTALGLGDLAEKNTVGSADIDDGSVGTDDLEDGGIGTADLADGAVTEQKIADDAVSSDKIADGAVGTPALANEAVTADKLAPGASGGVVAAGLAHYASDGDQGPGCGCFGDDGQLYLPTHYYGFANSYFNNKSVSQAGSSAAGGRFGFVPVFNVAYYGKVVRAVLTYANAFVITDTGNICGTGNDSYDQIGGGGNSKGWVLMAGPGKDGNGLDEYGNASPINKVMTQMSVSAEKLNGGNLNSSVYTAVLGRANDGRPHGWGYWGYGNGRGGTANLAGEVIQDELGADITDAVSVACGGGQYAVGMIERPTKVNGFGYNNYGQLGDGSTTNAHTSIVTGFSNPTTHGGIARIAFGGQASELQTWVHYNNNRLENCGIQGAEGSLGTGTTTNQTTPAATATDCADFWLSNGSSVATNSCSFLRTTGDVMKFCGSSEASNFPVLTASTYYTTWQTLTSGLFASGHADLMVQEHYSASSQSWYAVWSTGLLYVIGNSARDLFGFPNAGSFVAGVWDQVPIPLGDGDSLPTDREKFIASRYSYASTALITAKGKMLQGPGQAQRNGSFGELAGDKSGAWQEVFPGVN